MTNHRDVDVITSSADAASDERAILSELIQSRNGAEGVASVAVPLPTWLLKAMIASPSIRWAAGPKLALRDDLPDAIGIRLAHVGCEKTVSALALNPAAREPVLLALVDRVLALDPGSNTEMSLAHKLLMWWLPQGKALTPAVAARVVHARHICDTSAERQKWWAMFAGVNGELPSRTPHQWDAILSALGRAQLADLAPLPEDTLVFLANHEDANIRALVVQAIGAREIARSGDVGNRTTDPHDAASTGSSVSGRLSASSTPPATRRPR